MANATLKTELTDLHKIYQERILPIEKLTSEPYTDLAQRLIEFFSRKSLSQWQRHELSQWIFECIEYIQPLNPERSRELMSSYHQVLADFLDVDIEEIEGDANHHADPMDGLFDEFEDLEKAFNDTMNNENPKYQEDMFGFSENEDMHEAFEDFFSGENISEKPKEKNILSDKWLRTIFRRTANALHPDKERNEGLRKEKERLMSQLLTARDEKDVFSLLNLYMQHVDSDDLLVTDDSMEKLCEQLREQKNQLKEDRYQILHENPMYAALYENLHSRNNKTRERNIALHIQRVEESAHDFSQFVASLRNLKVLKVHLSDRYEEHQFSSLEDDPFEFYDF
ncbi:MAG: hypothetical protein KUG73_03270 [Pseudomonadales bacterium]|nr:hypothetical protein [Pseudomonadales bacterium]